MIVIPVWLWLWWREPNQTLSQKFPAARTPPAGLTLITIDGDYLEPFFSFPFNSIWFLKTICKNSNFLITFQFSYLERSAECAIYLK